MTTDSDSTLGSGPGPAVDGVAPTHPLIVAVRHLVQQVGAEFVATEEMTAKDVPLEWDGQIIAAVRLPTESAPPEAVGDLGLLLQDVAAELGGNLEALPRAQKQRAVRLLEERGAFTYRKSAEEVASALGVSRFTVYNYLNRSRGA
ncbi:helix-turn-helix domain-containing protein [Leekyejoonella antrihumi]|uniref:Transcriptional regulator n=1 Tax=Leekyejoonella antrihumi TaxID=1660198 RepID=A0A563DZA2_9MICO|nr:helix-turn-helix domain-containing protein [Leekyejoonella antrihumi]TWP35449.1 transcriptional regulator [Leekyejoonella antrihumi]